MWNTGNSNNQTGQVTARMETTPSLGSASISVSQQQTPKKFAPAVAPKPKFNPYKQMVDPADCDPAGKSMGERKKEQVVPVLSQCCLVTLPQPLLLFAAGKFKSFSVMFHNSVTLESWLIFYMWQWKLGVMYQYPGAPSDEECYECCRKRDNWQRLL